MKNDGDENDSDMIMVIMTNDDDNVTIMMWNNNQ